MKKVFLIVSILLFIVLFLLFNLKQEKIKNIINPTEESIKNDELIINFLDIGQGDATFIVFPDGQKMLVDCAIEGRIIEALGRVMEYWDHEIDYLLVTHPDLDHYGGCEEVMNRFEVKNIVYNGLQKEYDNLWNSFWQAIQSEEANYIEIDSEDVWQIASTSLHFYYPDHSIVDDQNIPGLEKDVGANNTSIVFELEYKDNEILFMGDAEEELEKYLLGVYGDQLDSDILKAGHHGSSGASSQEFIDLVTPQSAVFSCGLDNSFGHPSPRVIKRVERVSSTVWRTDLQGDIVARVGEKIKLEIK